jgi:ketosteroid isomerase-like protein
MNLPKTPEDAHATLAAAFNTGDVNTVLNMYDVTGIIVPEPGKPVSGKEEFKQATSRWADRNGISLMVATSK